MIERLVARDPNIRFKAEQSGSKIHFLDLKLEIVGNELKIGIFRKATHVWDLPKWGSRTTRLHKRAAVIPLMIRAHRLLTDAVTRSEEITKIFQKALTKGYPLNTLKKWNREGASIATRPKAERNKEMAYRNVTSTRLDWKIKEILRPEKIEMVSRKTNTLFYRLRNEKDKRDALETPGVYTIPLVRGNENKEYIGRTLKTVNVRINQHRDDVKRKVGTTTLANAVTYEGWIPEWEKTRVISRPQTLMRSVLAEYIEIRNARGRTVNAIEESDGWRHGERRLEEVIRKIQKKRTLNEVTKN